MKHTVVPCNLNYNTNKQIIEDLIKEYPFLNIQIIGRTAVGRSIFSLSTGNNKKGVIYVGSVHGDDGLTGLLLLLFIERLCKAMKYNRTLASVNIRKALSVSGVTVIPCLNPDGREIFLRGVNKTISAANCHGRTTTQLTGNASGVDINRNFIFYRESKSEPADYLLRGEYPESEAETRALTRICRLKKFRQCMELKTGADEILYRSDEGEPVSSQMMARILSATSMLPVNPEKNHCRGIQNWFIKEFQRPAFTLSACGTSDSLYEIYARLEETLTVFSLL